MDASFETRRIDVCGTNVTCYLTGKGEETILLLHGAGVDSALLSWGKVMPLLSRRYRVIAVDLPGYGTSDRIESDYSLAFYTGIVQGVIEALSIDPVILAGLSLGGGIALNLALTQSRLVKVLIPVDAWGFFEKLPWHRLTHWYTRTWLNDNLYDWTRNSRFAIRWSLEANLFGDKSKVTEALVDQVQRAMQEPDAGKPFVSFQRSEITPTGFRTDLFGKLEQISQPTLIIHGALDKAVPVEGAIRASRLIPDCELYLMEGCKHWPQKERPDEFAHVVLSYLERRMEM